MDLSFDNVLFAFLLTLFAGAATAIGSVIAFFAKQTNKSFLSLSLGFSAGVMMYVSFVEIFPESVVMFANQYSESKAELFTTIFFFVGIAIIAIIDRLVPDGENPHEFKSVEQMGSKDNRSQLLRLGLFSALAIGIHNFPEGVATFTAALIEPSIAIPIAVAIAIHNIPEGIAISVPVYHATGSKKRAFLLSALSGLSEPIGAMVAFGVIMLIGDVNHSFLGGVFAITAGVMVYISMDELLPSAEKYGNHHTSIIGFILGMGVMAFSLLII